MKIIDIKDFLIDEDSTMLEAMALIDKLAKKILFVEKEKRLVATITDGDIRRWILKKGSLEAKVRDIANYSPKSIYEQDKFTAQDYMKKFTIEALPVVNHDKRIISIIFLNDGEINRRKKLDVPVVIMAGGLGTRLYPYTKILPKPLIPIGEIPITEHIINKFNRYGFQEFFMILNHKKNMVKAYFNDLEKKYEIKYVDENEPLGTGGGLSLLEGKINSTFILTNCDILIEEDYEKIYNFHKKGGNLITMVCSLKKVKIPYGVVEIGSDGEIDSMREKPEISFFTNTGYYVVESRVIEQLDKNTSISFPDIIQKYKDAGEKIGIYPISERAWMDMGQLEEMEKMSKRLCDE